MANEKFDPQGQITDIEIRLECLRLATEFGPEPSNSCKKSFKTWRHSTD
jgi:hypothetical protein